MINILTTKYNVDPTRVYLHGYSNGAMMTYRATCQMGDMLKSAVIYAGALESKRMTKDNSVSAGQAGVSLDGTTTFYELKPNLTEVDWNGFTPDNYVCDKAKFVDLLIIHGTDDPVVPINGRVMTVNDPNV